MAGCYQINDALLKFHWTERDNVASRKMAYSISPVITKFLQTVYARQLSVL